MDYIKNLENELDLLIEKYLKAKDEFENPNYDDEEVQSEIDDSFAFMKYIHSKIETYIECALTIKLIDSNKADELKNKYRNQF
jgi:hypothetical protein